MKGSAIIPPSRALAISRNYLADVLQLDGSAMIRPWRDGLPGEPILVNTVDREPSYWIVPVEGLGRALGYIEIGPEGTVLGHAYLYQNPNEVSNCPDLATRISAKQALELAQSVLKKYAGATVSDPLFVHDGARSRVAWMIEIRTKDRLISQVFVTPDDVYERKTTPFS